VKDLIIKIITKKGKTQYSYFKPNTVKDFSIEQFGFNIVSSIIHNNSNRESNRSRQTTTYYNIPVKNKNCFPTLNEGFNASKYDNLKINKISFDISQSTYFSNRSICNKPRFSISTPNSFFINLSSKIHKCNMETQTVINLVL